ncbi:MAG: hydroxyethylthiazole kinase [Treponema sp.]|jgi:hydroxyethylthiazole kinase|nr:hydroxyethylthiazole kinase [Treponema sp.]
MKEPVKTQAARIVDAVRETSPLIHCITNFVSVNDCANILLAFGASPAMIGDFDEAYDFATISGALYINIGTSTRQDEAGILHAALGAKAAGKPIVFDPVGCGAIPRRIAVLEHLHHVTGIDIIKGNMGEIMALAGQSVTVKGVDSDGDVEGIEESAIALAKKYRCTIAATGKADVVTDGKELVRLRNGVELLTKITGAGCMAGALCGASAAAASLKGGTMFAATVAAITALSIAGEIAAEKTALPGSFRVALIDAIYGINGALIQEKGTIGC